MSRQGRHGESNFATMCQSPSACTEAVVNKAADDEHGWDYIVDLVPPAPSDRPADLRDDLFQSFVQIKTTRGQKTVTKLKLSNALKAAKSTAPNFIFLFHYVAQHEDPILYGKHIGEEEIARFLSRGREISVAKSVKQTHKATVSISFGDDDRIHRSPSDWMMDKILEYGGSDYSSRKSNLISTVGYDDVKYEGTLSIPPSIAISDIVSHELGLSESIPFTDFQLFDKRFGIKSLISDRQLSEGQLSIAPLGQPLTLQITSDRQETIRIPALMYIPKLVSFDHEEFQYRISAGCLDMLGSQSKGIHTVNYSLNTAQTGTFLQKIGLACFLSWSDNRPMNFELQSDVGNFQSGRFEEKRTVDSWVHQHAAVGIHVLHLMGLEKANDIEISYYHFQECVKDLHLAATIFGGGVFRIEGDFDGPLDEFGSLLGYACTSIGNWSVGGIYQLDHTNRVVNENRQDLQFEAPRVVKSFAFKQPIKSFRNFVKSEFDNARAHIGHPTAVIRNGDWGKWSRKMHIDRNITIGVG